MVPGLHTSRPIRFHEVLQCGSRGPSWMTKFYTITARAGTEKPPGELIEAAKFAILQEQHRLQSLPNPPPESSPGLGVVAAVACVHEANDANFLLTGHWAYTNVLVTQVFAFDFQQPTKPQLLVDPGTPLCAWETQIIGFESQAWIEVLKNPTPASLQTYLSTVLNINF